MPFTDVNTEAIGLYAIIFDGLYRSLIFSSLLFTLDIAHHHIIIIHCHIPIVHHCIDIVIYVSLHSVALGPPCQYLPELSVNKHSQHVTVKSASYCFVCAM